jgi:hypothetical protein
MALDLGPLKTVVDDLVKAAESVGSDLVNQEAGIAQEDLDGLTNALQGVHAKIAPAAPAATDTGAPAASATPASEPAAAPVAEGSGSAGTGVQLPPLNTGS